MKRALSFILIFMLIISTIGPLPNIFAQTSTTIAKVEGSVANSNGTGTITVTFNTPTAGDKVLLYNHNDIIVGVHTITSSEMTHQFIELTPGKYEVMIEGSTSKFEAFVTPSPVKAGFVESPQKQVSVQDAIPGAQLVLYRTDKPGFLERTVVADEKGRGSFIIGYESHQVPPGENYQVKQRINGAESLGTPHFNVNPEPVTISAISGSGKNNDQGAIRVTGTRSGNKLYLYNDKDRTQYIREETATGSEHTFTGLPAGDYYVIQEEDGAKSERSSIVTIQDNVDPTITLNVDEHLRVPITGNPDTFVYRPNATDVNVNDNIKLADENALVWEPLEIRDPGEYTITYTATDASGNKTSISRKVTILPPTLSIAETKHTCINLSSPDSDGYRDCTNPSIWRSTGDIVVDNVMANATIRIYQDPSGKFIKAIQATNKGRFEISDINVGANYYVTQVVNGIESEPSQRTTIRDNTPPIINLLNDDEVYFVRGSNYIEYGATATDNIDESNEISSKIVIDSSKVNMEVPGVYEVTYNVTDNAGNRAKQKVRKVVVSPHPVIAIGSYASLGEVSVKNAFPGSILKLYSVTDEHNPIAVSEKLPVGVTTYVFQFKTAFDSNGNPIGNTNEIIPPGSYYVIQEFFVDGLTEPLRSVRSNIVDVIDTDRPYITLEGSENLFYVWDETKDYYSYDSILEQGNFDDPGAVANDYLDDSEELTKKIERKIFFGTTLKCDDSVVDDNGNKTNPCPTSLNITEPGVYKIHYNVTTKRGTKANEKVRTITVAPPVVKEIQAPREESKINVSGVFKNDTTIVTLYNSYGQIISTKIMKNEMNDVSTSFDEIPAGLGYYVTQTVNGIESKPSNPVNVTIYGDANKPALITSFDLKHKTYGTSIGANVVIDHDEETILVIVPSNISEIDLLNYKASWESVGGVTPPTINHTFDEPLSYTVTSEDGNTIKRYKVTVIKGSELELAKNTLNKMIGNLSSTRKSITLTQAEKETAIEKGVTFIANDTAIFVPSGNFIESKEPTLSVKRITNGIELDWGGRKYSFVQPIEVEMPNPSNLKFAKTVVSDGTTYSIIQPSEKNGENIIGLATESGTYNLVNNVSKPVVTKVGSSYRLSLPTGTSGTIYYTTNSSQISYDYSARSNSFIADSFTLNSSFDISTWETATNGELVSSPTEEIYAFVLNNNVISPLAVVVPDEPTEWSTIIPTYSTSHVLRVTFSAKVQRKALYSNEIYVIDDATGKKHPVELQLSDDGKTLLIVPETQYKTGNQYTLVINRNIKGLTTSNEFLKKPIIHKFKTK